MTTQGSGSSRLRGTDGQASSGTGAPRPVDHPLEAPIETPAEALGASDAFLSFQEALSDAAKAERPVILVGERGTGKELAAQRLHFLSARWQGPFVPMNCAALAENLMESELFGHEAGAFTGAAARRRGRFELAHQGTLFLDEVAGLTLAAQEKMLRVVEYGVFERLGGAGPVAVDVRLVAAANVDLPALAERGRFRRDLLDRLAFEVLTLPPLRAREGDIPLLAAHFAARMASELGGVIELADPALGALESHPWPGNVRELKNVVERAVYRALSRGRDRVEEVCLDPFASPWRPAASGPVGTRPQAPSAPEAAPAVDEAAPSLPERVKQLEREALQEALAASGGRQKRAAARLGMSYHSFRNLLRKHKQSLDAIAKGRGLA